MPGGFRGSLVFFFCFLSAGIGGRAFPETTAPEAGAGEGVIQIERPKVAGRIFDVDVSMDNYLFARAAAQVFGASWGREVRTPEELEERTWEDLILSYEAFRRGLEVPQEKVDEELDKVLKAEKVTFDRKKDPQAFEDWVRARVGEPAELFENQLKHLIQLKMLRDEVRASFDPAVTREEALAKYITEYDSLELQLVRFDALGDAQAFFERVTRKPALWDREFKKNEKSKDYVKTTGFVSFEWLMDAWKIPRKDLDAMLGREAGSFYGPTPLYKGYAVHKILKKRPAVPEDFNDQMLKQYLGRVKEIKQ
ncbi:MAG: hypothetical protein ACM3L6_05945, partial [Deltaproteobacteria bacterium]